MSERDEIGRAREQKADILAVGGYGRQDRRLVTKGGRRLAVTVGAVVAWMEAGESFRSKLIGTSRQAAPHGVSRSAGTVLCLRTPAVGRGYKWIDMLEG